MCDYLIYFEYYILNIFIVWKWIFLGDGDFFLGLVRVDLCGDVGGISIG